MAIKFSNPWMAALYAALYSCFISAFTIVSTAIGVGLTLGPKNGGFDDLTTFITFMSHAWFGCVLGFVFQVGPYVRAKQGFTASKNGGATAPPPEQNQPDK